MTIKFICVRLKNSYGPTIVYLRPVSMQADNRILGNAHWLPALTCSAFVRARQSSH